MTTPASRIPQRVVILGVGNLLLSDEGLGVRALESIDRHYTFPDGVELVDGGTCGMELLEPLTNVDLLIMLDVIRAGRPPGSLIILRGDEIPARLRHKLSPHQVGLSDVLATLILTGEAPREIIVIGIEPESLELGMALTSKVAARLPELITATLTELEQSGIRATPRTTTLPCDARLAAQTVALS